MTEYISFWGFFIFDLLHELRKYTFTTLQSLGYWFVFKETRTAILFNAILCDNFCSVLYTLYIPVLVKERLPRIKSQKKSNILKIYWEINCKNCLSSLFSRMYMSFKYIVVIYDILVPCGILSMFYSTVI